MGKAEREGTRFVWVRSPLGRTGAKPGLVTKWRKVQRGASPPAWQAYVVSYDERFDGVDGAWFYATELEPVKSQPPTQT